jgi:carboxyl-terminal processing protease
MSIFDYATEYALAHPTIAPAETFELSDEDYEAFKSYLKSTGFNYDKESYKILVQLKKMLSLEGYEETTKAEIEKLEKTLQHNLDHDLTFFAKDIKQLIADEIIKRYYSQAGSIVFAMRDDADLEESFKILGDSKLYKKILSPAEKGKEAKTDSKKKSIVSTSLPKTIGPYLAMRYGPPFYSRNFILRNA